MQSSHDSLHPEVKSLVAGKRPKTTRSTAETAPPANALVSVRVKEEPDDEVTAAEGGVSAEDLPGYVAPLAKKIDVTDVMAEPRSGLQPKTKRRFVIGNVSKWIECSEREDSSTHKWMLYVRGCKELPDVSDVVKKVRYTEKLHNHIFYAVLMLYKKRSILTLLVPVFYDFLKFP